MKFLWILLILILSCEVAPTVKNEDMQPHPAMRDFVSRMQGSSYLCAFGGFMRWECTIFFDQPKLPVAVVCVTDGCFLKQQNVVINHN